MDGGSAVKFSPSRFISAAACAVIALLTVSPAHASAQPAQLDGATSKAKDTASQVGKTVDSAAGSTTEAAKNTVTEVEKTVSETTSGVGTAGGSTTSKVKETVKEASSTVTKTVSGAGSGVTTIVDKTVNRAGEAVDDLTPREEGVGGKEPKDARTGRNNRSGTGSTGPGESGSLSRVSPDRLYAASEIPQLPAVPLTGTAPTGARDDGGVWADVIRRALEATQKFAFPLALTLLVVGYLAFQGWMDRRDPKLALNAADHETDLLSFE